MLLDAGLGGSPTLLDAGSEQRAARGSAQSPCMAVSTRPAQVCISVHDVAPATWPACRRLLAMLDRFGPLPLTFLVVPDYHRRGRIDACPEFLAAMEQRLARGDEVALHGYYHLDESPAPRRAGDWFRRRMMTDSEGEFAALSAAEAGQRLDRGVELMRRLGWPTPGFIAPAWLLGDGAREALGHFSFTYTTTRSGIVRLPDWRFTSAPALAYSVRSFARRRLSLTMNALQMRLLGRSRLLRLSLHPVDGRHDAVMAQWQRIIGNVLETHRPVTKAQWVASGR